MSNYYAVKIGRNPGVYETWGECKKQVDKFPSAKYKKFNSKDEALAFINEEQFIQNKKIDIDNYDAIIYIDGSYNAKMSSYGFGMHVILKDRKEESYFGCGQDNELAQVRNVAGELLGAIRALQYANNNKLRNIKLCYDFEGIEKWITGKWETKNNITKSYKEEFIKLSEGINIKFEKVKAHSGEKYNEIVDKLAKKSVGLE